MIKVLPKILKEVEALEEKNKNDSKTILTIKEKSIFDELKSELDKYSDTFNLEGIEIVEDKNIVGGFVLKDKKNMVDKSYKTALISMYNKMVK
jgi:F0F1-type ATP synthase delta subunit